MAVLGMWVTTNLEATERSHAWRLGIMDQFPDAAPLCHMIYRVGKEKASDPYFRWHERLFNPRELTLAATVSDTASTTAQLTLASGQAYFCRTGTLIWNPTTEELVRVYQDPSAGVNNLVLVTRAYASTTPAAWTSADKVQIIGNAQPEGGSLGAAIGYAPSAYDNYCQIFRNVADISRTAAKTKLRTGDKRADAQKQALRDHELDKEWAFLFGVKGEDTSTSPGATRTTGGLYERITSHIYNASDALTLSDWNDFLADVFANGSEEKLLLAGSKMMLALEDMARAYTYAWTDVGKQDTFGMNLRSWKTAWGTLMIKEHKLLSLSTAYQDWGFIVDPDEFVYRFVDDTTWLPNRQDNGADRITGEYLAEVGLEVHQEFNHGVIKNCSAFAG